MKVKIILTALWFAVVANGVPLSDVKTVPATYTYLDFAPKDEFVAPSLFGEPIEKVKLIDDDDLNYRLPNNSRPIRYDLWLKTDVDKNNFDFSGRVKIHIKILEPTQQITLHARQLTIDNVDLLNTDNTLRQANLVHNYDEVLEFLIISLPSQLTVDDELILDITYQGILREDGSGFYRASYRDENDNQVWFATTQFEMTDARHAMPCYDEPGIRAVYGLEIQHDQSLNAISNMPISTRDLVQGTNYVTSKFQETVVMQSYLLAFIISDYTYISNNDVNVEQRIYAVPQRIERGDGAFALGVVGPVLKQLQDHFQVNYPLPKMDHAAITDYIWGAMENFGLITYQDRSLLFVEGTDTDSKKLSIIELIAHEYTHQYFGNIVSPKWWAYTWLNEGFATLFANYIPSLIYPENLHMQRFETNALSAAFNVDSNPSVPHLNFYVQTPIDIRNKFGTVSYQKGGSMLRMFQEALTVPTFTKGLNYYLTEMYLQAATPQDLHRNLQKAYDEDFPTNYVNIDAVMTSWQEQAGYPVIRVQKIAESFFFTQQRFGGGDEIYSIPISYTVKSELDFETKTPKIWFDSRSLALSSHEDWIILNIGNTGYFKISYDQNIFASIAADLQVNHQIISAYHRAQLFTNMRTSLLEESFGAFYGLEHMNYLSQEEVFSVWNQAFGVESIFSEHLFGVPVLSKYHDFLQSITAPHVARLGWTAVTGEASNNADLRGLITTLSCKSYQQECLNFELQRLENFVANGQGAYNLCNGLRSADANLHATLINNLLSNQVSNRNNYINNLGCPLRSDLINNYLQLVLDESNILNPNERLAIIQQTPGKSVLALETVLDFVQQNYVAVQRV